MDVFTTRDTDGVPEGSCVQDCVSVEINGVKYWQGMWCSMAGSYTVQVEQANCEVEET